MLVAALQSCVDDLARRVDVIDHGLTRGIFDAGELARHATRAPALWLHLANLEPTETSGGGDAYDYDAALTLYVIARDRLGSQRLEGALDALVLPLLGYIPGQRWGGDPWRNGAGAVAARTLYATAIDQQGLALWTLEWDQTLRLPRIRS
ncbi:MAG: hypothetical protein MUC79_16055 [Thiobacillaceae bacterium]|jgi:hypothetical protein|nr:hypothetical protein [Thiobacillaceae bacterium]